MTDLGSLTTGLMKKLSGKKMAVGVDVGTKSIKIVALKKDGDKIILDNYVIAQTEKPLIKIGQSGVINDFAGNVVKLAMEEGGIKERHVNVAIPGFTSLIVTIEVQGVVEDKKFAEAVRREVSKYIPVKIDDVVYDWQIIDEESLKGSVSEEERRKPGGNRTVKILVIAIMKEISGKYDRVFSENKLSISLLEIDSISLTRALTHNKPGVHLILDIGHETCNILVASQQGVLLNRTIDVGGDRMTQVIADALRVDFARAEQLKKEQGVNVKVSNQEGGVLTTVLGIIIGEIKKTIQLFNSDFENVSIDKIFLSGGSANMIGLRELIQKEVGKETMIGNALEGISFVAEAREHLLRNAPSLSIAIGLALADFEEE